MASLTACAEAELLQLDEHVGGEVVVQHGGTDVGRADARLPPELAADDADLRERGEVVTVVAGHGVLARAAPLRGGGDHGGGLWQIAGAFRARDHDSHGAVALLAAVQQAQRLGDPAGCLVLRERDRALIEPCDRVGGGVAARRDGDPAEVLAGRPRLVHIPAGDHRDRRRRRGQAHRVVPAVVDPRRRRGGSQSGCHPAETAARTLVEGPVADHDVRRSGGDGHRRLLDSRAGGAPTVADLAEEPQLAEAELAGDGDLGGAVHGEGDQTVDVGGGQAGVGDG